MSKQNARTPLLSNPGSLPGISEVGNDNMTTNLLQEVNNNATLAKGLLTSFQLHIGEDEWKKLVDELKEVEDRRTKEEDEPEKKLDLDGVE